MQTNHVNHDAMEYSDANHSSLEVHGGKLGWVVAQLWMRCHDASFIGAQRRILNVFADHLEGPCP